MLFDPELVRGGRCHGFALLLELAPALVLNGVPRILHWR